MLIINSTKYKKAIATALNWQVLDPFGNSLFGHKQLIEYIKTGGYVGISFKNGKDTNLGVGRENALDAGKQLKVISIAHRVAMHAQMKERSLVVFLKNTASGDESIFAIGLINGNVVIDQLIDAAEIEQIVRDFTKINIFTTTNIEIFGDIDMDQFSISKTITLEDILGNDAGSKIYVETLKNSLILFYFVLSVIIILIAYFLYGVWQESVLNGETALSSKLKVINSPENIYSQRINSFLKKPLNLAKSNISSVLGDLGAFPFVLAKWRVQSIQCENYVCLVSWTSLGGGYQDFSKAAKPNWSNINLDTTNGTLLGDMNSLKNNFSIASQQGLLPEFKDIPKFENFTFAMGDLLRAQSKKGWTCILNTPVQIETSNENSEVSIKNHPLAILAIPWSARNQGWVETELALLEFGETCTLETVKLEFKDQKPSLSTSGRCYVKK